MKRAIAAMIVAFFIPTVGSTKESSKASLASKWEWGPPAVNHGFIDKSGRFVLPTSSEYSFEGFLFSEGLLVASKREKAPKSLREPPSERLGYIDTTGGWVIQPQYAQAKSFSEGLAAVNIGGHWIETSPNAFDFHGGKWGFIDRTGKLIIPAQFDEVYYDAQFSEGMCGVRVDKKWGYIDHSGNWVIQPQFGQVSRFSEGAAYAFEGDAYVPETPPTKQ
jgi:hypothetical protein